jgi:hypothetical protein
MSNQNVVQINLQNNLREVADLPDSRISAEETRFATIMRTLNISRENRQMALWFSQMMDRLEPIDNLLNAYLALVLYRQPPRSNQGGSNRPTVIYRGKQVSELSRHCPERTPPPHRTF